MKPPPILNSNTTVFGQIVINVGLHTLIQDSIHLKYLEIITPTRKCNISTKYSKSLTLK